MALSVRQPSMAQVPVLPVSAPVLILSIAVVATAGVIVRPLGLPEAVWPLLGAVVLLVLRLMTPAAALVGILRGLDVYLFLTGMMLLSEIARHEGLFDWLAAVATRLAKGSASRLLLLVYGVGAVVTVFLSNDATAVVLTPAVAAAIAAARARQRLPYLLACAFVANAASFVLPISNPANLVIYGPRMPSLQHWLPRYLLPSLVSIAATYLVLRWTQRGTMRQRIATDVPIPVLSASGRTAAIGIALTAVVLLVASALDLPLGWPTAIAGLVTVMIVLVREGKAPWALLRDIAWGVIPLVAGLFMLVEALDRIGWVQYLVGLLQQAAERSATSAAWTSGTLIALACNVMNNLPAGLIAGSALQGSQSPDIITRAILIGVDLGPNLSVTGSLATILWLAALRREGIHISALEFLRIGMLTMPPALLLAIGASLLM
jgi:arsenical pump membrane protein